MHIVLGPVGVGLEPACVKACPTGAIMFGSKSDMTDWAGERIKDLKSRVSRCRALRSAGCERHACYVRAASCGQTVDLCGSSDKPHISTFVGLWKGIIKPVALAGPRITALAGSSIGLQSDRTTCSPKMNPKRSACCIQRMVPP